MHAYSWPGNVRELMNRVRRAIAMTDGEFVTAEDLGLVEVDPSVTHAHLGDARSVAEKQILIDALRHADGNASRAATLLGVSRATLYRLIGKHGLTAEETGVHRGLSHRSQVDRHAENGTKTPPAC
jgi:excisionase family DNA binding protein